MGLSVLDALTLWRVRLCGGKCFLCHLGLFDDPDHREQLAGAEWQANFGMKVLSVPCAAHPIGPACFVCCVVGAGLVCSAIHRLQGVGHACANLSAVRIQHPVLA